MQQPKSKKKQSVATVSINELQKDMTILAYTGFSHRYKEIDEKMCRFLHHNFSGAKARIIRGGKKQDIPVTSIMTGDTILALFAFPAARRQLTKADPKLITALKKKGIHAFKIRQTNGNRFDGHLDDAIDEVNRLMKTPSRKQERLERGIFEANLLVERVKEAGSKRREGSNIIENMMDTARAGQLKTSDIEYYVEGIVRNSTSEAMSAIISLRASDQTYSHCIDVGVLFQHLYFLSVKRYRHHSVFEHQKQALLGAFLHDFGKSRLPKDLLDSTARFEIESKEMELIRDHPKYGAKILSGMEMPDSIINMCLCHHIKLDESLKTSYPSDVSYAESRFEARLLALADIYQALVGRRVYKRSWTPPQAMRYLSALAGIEYDTQTFEVFLRLMGEYPIGSLVVLSDESMGFVVNVPGKDEDLLRPQVAVIRNTHGEDLSRHTLLDLQEEQDISIKNDLDATDVFKQGALQKFSEMKVVA